MNETFHVIDSVTVYDRERIQRRRQMAKGSPDKALSSFVWNETVFNSFKAGYIKALDFDFYKSLDGAITKRMFRFLDKRFYHKPRWEFDLRAFACEHVGLSKNYSNSELKRKLVPAVKELEVRGFLAPLPDAERFVQVRVGEWKAVFVKAASRVKNLPSPEDDSLVKELVARGISERSAMKLVAHYPRAKIEEKVKLFDAVRKQGGEGKIKNRAGWLYAAIVNDYSAGEGTKSTVTAPASPPSPAVTIEAQPVAPSPASLAFEAFWGALPPAEREAFETDAVATAPSFLQKQYHDGKAAQGTLWRVTRERILFAYFARTNSDAVA